MPALTGLSKRACSQFPVRTLLETLMQDDWDWNCELARILNGRMQVSARFGCEYVLCIESRCSRCVLMCGADCDERRGRAGPPGAAGDALVSVLEVGALAGLQGLIQTLSPKPRQH